MKYLLISLLILVTPVQAAENATFLSTQACLELIKEYWTTFEANGAEPTNLYDRFANQCQATSELDALMLNDEYITAVTTRLAEKGLLN
ncbi:MAG: hypothetical protein OEZ15_08045 [Gammaproteobacteria bacterium]|nr:hypothetical protein [Gammaproteobacteria bacterium]